MAPTASEVIEQGDYLNDNFNANSLTIPILLSILNLHNVTYPSQHNKRQLVELFNNHIKPNAAELRAQREIDSSSQPSDRGIRDGITGRQIGEPNTPPVRRSSRHNSRAPTESPPREPAKRVRKRPASEEPSQPRRTTKYQQANALILEEQSEPEEELLPKLSKMEKKKRRVSTKFGSGADDSHWEADQNVFQSGAESTPPKPPKHVSKAGSSGIRRPRVTRRVSASAPPDPPPTSLSMPTIRTTPPPSSAFAPRLPSNIPRRSTRQVSTDRVAKPQEPLHFSSSFDVDPPRPSRLNSRTVSGPQDMAEVSMMVKAEAESDEGEEEAENIVGEQVEVSEDAISEKISSSQEEEQQLAVARRRPAQQSSGLLRTIVFILIAAATIPLGSYKMESASIGYCDTGSDTNAILIANQEARRNAIECNAKLMENRNNTEGDEQTLECPLPPLPLPHPTFCTPCPVRAVCTPPHMISCQPNFVMRPHPLSLVPGLSDIADGLPGLGNVAFPPSCVEDREKLKKVSSVGRRVERWLAKARGEKVCQGVFDPTADGGEAKAWGVLREEVRKLSKSSSKFSEDIFEQAMIDLEKNGLIATSIDSEGTEWVAAIRDDMTMQCKARVAARETWKEWQRTLYALFIAIGTIFWGRSKYSSSAREAKRVAALVQVALDALQDQEYANHSDPANHPHPFISSLHLRDHILQDEHSIPARRKLWEKVERVVEGNANVRVNMEEVNGDETRVWRWIGVSRVKFAERGQGGRIIA